MRSIAKSWWLCAYKKSHAQQRAHTTRMYKSIESGNQNERWMNCLEYICGLGTISSSSHQAMAMQISWSSLMHRTVSSAHVWRRRSSQESSRFYPHYVTLCQLVFMISLMSTAAARGRPSIELILNESTVLGGVIDDLLPANSARWVSNFTKNLHTFQIKKKKDDDWAPALLSCWKRSNGNVSYVSRDSSYYKLSRASLHKKMK